MLQATPQILDDLDSYLPTQRDTSKIAQFFALLADQPRVRLLSALAIACGYVAASALFGGAL